MANVSALVVSWTMVIRTVVTSIRHNLDVVASGAEAVFYPDGPPESGRLRALLIAMADTLERLLEELATREKELEMERGDDPAVREDDRSAYSALRARVIRTRSIIDGAFGPAIAAKLGFTGETPENEDALAQYAGTAIEALRAGVLPEPGDDGVTIDAGRLADQIEADSTALKNAQRAVAEEVRQAQTAITARDDAEATLRGAYVGIADTFTAWALLAGRPDIADRVRPTARRRAGLPEATDSESSGATQPTATPGTGAQDTGAQSTGGQDAGAQSTGAQDAGAQSTGAQGGSAPSGAEKKLVDGSTGG